MDSWNNQVLKGPRWSMALGLSVCWKQGDKDVCVPVDWLWLFMQGSHRNVPRYVEHNIDKMEVVDNHLI